MLNNDSVLYKQKDYKISYKPANEFVPKSASEIYNITQHAIELHDIERKKLILLKYKELESEIVKAAENRKLYLDTSISGISVTSLDTIVLMLQDNGFTTKITELEFNYLITISWDINSIIKKEE